jgi:predicted transcriptional regulator of viral defense system
VHRAVYRLTQYPIGEQEDLAAIWLQTGREGVFSHETALALYGLSDVLPAHIHLTVPVSRRRRRKLQDDVVVHLGDVPENERGWHGPVPITSVRRTLIDCAVAGLSPELLQSAATQAIRRGLITQSELPEVERALAPFGGLRA